MKLASSWRQAGSSDGLRGLYVVLPEFIQQRLITYIQAIRCFLAMPVRLAQRLPDRVSFRFSLD
jgi:hypothetical protein